MLSHAARASCFVCIYMCAILSIGWLEINVGPHEKAMTIKTTNVCIMSIYKTTNQEYYNRS